MERKNPGLGGVLWPLGRLGRSKSAFGPQGGGLCTWHGPYVGWFEALGMPFGVSNMFSALLELICAKKSMPYKWIFPTLLPWV